MSKVDVVIIGAGVIGAAIAQRLSLVNKSVIVLEAHDRIAEGITSRNSGVIHAGLYYSPQSLKATLCVRGKTLLYQWAQLKHLPHQRTGKFIIATNEREQEELENLYSNAHQSGATGLNQWSRLRLSQVLPHISAKEALFSEDTGIIDAYSLTRSLFDDAESNGCHILTHAAVHAIDTVASGYTVHSARGSVHAEIVINTAGLQSDAIARLVGIHKYLIYPCRGDYFRVRTGLKLGHLLYPVKPKNAPGLGIHITLELDGSIRLGPDAEYVNTRDDFSPRYEKLETFRKSAEKFLGPLLPEQLFYDQCGIRPKLRSPQDSEEKDFHIYEDLPGFINLVGIESPGLTSCLAIAEYVHKKFF